MFTTETDRIIRELAKSNEYQTIYGLGKDFKLNLFNNSSDFTYIQLLFLNYLNFYASLFLDIYLEEVDEKVLEDIIYEDAYAYYKNKRSSKQKEEKISQSSSNIEKLNVVKSKWNFRKK